MNWNSSQEHLLTDDIKDSMAPGPTDSPRIEHTICKIHTKSDLPGSDSSHMYQAGGESEVEVEDALQNTGNSRETPTSLGQGGPAKPLVFKPILLPPPSSAATNTLNLSGHAGPAIAQGAGAGPPLLNSGLKPGKGANSSNNKAALEDEEMRGEEEDDDEDDEEEEDESANSIKRMREPRDGWPPITCMFETFTTGIPKCQLVKCTQGTEKYLVGMLFTGGSGAENKANPDKTGLLSDKERLKATIRKCLKTETNAADYAQIIPAQGDSTTKDRFSPPWSFFLGSMNSDELYRLLVDPVYIYKDICSFILFEPTKTHFPSFVMIIEGDDIFPNNEGRNAKAVRDMVKGAVNKNPKFHAFMAKLFPGLPANSLLNKMQLVIQDIDVCIQYKDVKGSVIKGYAVYCDFPLDPTADTNDLYLEWLSIFRSGSYEHGLISFKTNMWKCHICKDSTREVGLSPEAVAMAMARDEVILRIEAGAEEIVEAADSEVVSDHGHLCELGCFLPADAT
ncbi:hypothetical protein C8J56DRAFT_887989 [Mycena floridula]|nr:hypothetical protein C8J56DRAFT_887989 [Mycena floridula]